MAASVQCIEDLWIVEGALSGVKAFYRDKAPCIIFKGEMTIQNKMTVRQGCVMSPWLYSLFMNGLARKMDSKVGNVVEISEDTTEWKLSTLSADTKYYKQREK